MATAYKYILYSKKAIAIHKFRIGIARRQIVLITKKKKTQTHTTDTMMTENSNLFVILLVFLFCNTKYVMCVEMAVLAFIYY